MIKILKKLKKKILKLQIANKKLKNDLWDYEDANHNLVSLRDEAYEKLDTLELEVIELKEIRAKLLNTIRLQDVELMKNIMKTINKE